MLAPNNNELFSSLTLAEIQTAWAADIAIAHAQATIRRSSLEKMLEKPPLPIVVGKVGTA
jgi:hypothetical protein